MRLKRIYPNREIPMLNFGSSYASIFTLLFLSSLFHAQANSLDSLNEIGVDMESGANPKDSDAMICLDCSQFKISKISSSNKILTLNDILSFRLGYRGPLYEKVLLKIKTPIGMSAGQAKYIRYDHSLRSSLYNFTLPCLDGEFVVSAQSNSASRGCADCDLFSFRASCEQRVSVNPCDIGLTMNESGEVTMVNNDSFFPTLVTGDGFSKLLNEKNAKGIVGGDTATIKVGSDSSSCFTCGIAEPPVRQVGQAVDWRNWKKEIEVDFRRFQSVKELVEAGYSTKYEWSRKYIINKELQYYADPFDLKGLPTNMKLTRDGVAVIANYIKSGQRHLNNNQQFSSAVLSTLNHHEALYGRIESEIKFPCGEGLWPAFWGIGYRATKPKGGIWPDEIDFFEHVNNQAAYWNSLHWPTSSGQKHFSSIVTPSGATSPNSHICDGEFHTYGIEWSPKWIRFYMDGIYTTVVPNSNYHTPLIQQWNLAIGGTASGEPDPNKFPQKMYIRSHRYATYQDESQRSNVKCVKFENSESVTFEPKNNQEGRL